ncbi:glycoside hydrolase family 43 protein [Sphingomonas sp. AP4-R1]|uniref:glycoside hydrolase family 43 protein n=1 Tax=Sphingomonas sp. AP4-R1 TaxID=2735134 RepID=UPI0020A43EB0|nr:glycoside hydrolase family 43 protein [Sphingomonas sp. AP4-R1]
MDIPIGRRDLLLGAGATALIGTTASGKVSPADPLLFAYFLTGKDDGVGLKLATSDDGYTFRALGGGRTFLAPEVGEKKLLRDPFVFRGAGPDAPWHMVWTTAWEGVTIGHATTRDFLHWSPQRAIPVMEGVAGVRNCWAPEAIHDPATGLFTLFWSSTVTGRFTETASSSESAYNHRLWCTRTRDFERFTPPEPFYDPGFSVIDGTFATAPDGSLTLIVKDETVTPPRKWLRAAKARGPNGPFEPLGAPFTPSWVEGPMTTRIGADLVCYYDVYRDGRWGAAKTRDMVTWQDVSDRLTMPPGARHGSLVRVPKEVIAALG